MAQKELTISAGANRSATARGQGLRTLFIFMYHDISPAAMFGGHGRTTAAHELGVATRGRTTGEGGLKRCFGVSAGSETVATSIAWRLGAALPAFSISALRRAALFPRAIATTSGTASASAACSATAPLLSAGIWRHYCKSWRRHIRSLQPRATACDVYHPSEAHGGGRSLLGRANRRGRRHGGLCEMPPARYGKSETVAHCLLISWRS